MDLAKRAAALAGGLVLLSLGRIQMDRVLAAEPFHAYDFEWFLKLGPGEGNAYLWLFLLGAPGVFLLAWGLRPLLERTLRKPPAMTGTVFLLLAGLLASSLTAGLGWGLLDGGMVTDDENVYLFTDPQKFVSRDALKDLDCARLALDGAKVGVAAGTYDASKRRVETLRDRRGDGSCVA